MARITKTRKPQAAPKTAMELLMREHLEALRVRGYSEYTVKNRLVHIGFFVEWAYEHGLREPIEVTRPVLERYQRYLFFYRKKNGEPLTFRSQHARLVPLRVWFRWMTRQNHILHNPASEIDLPRLGRTLPKIILSIEEIEQVMVQPNITDPIGLRDRAILETIYATGLRRLEVVRLKLFDLQLDRGLVLVNQGKGKKDRYVPIGERAAAWLRKYIAEARPQLAIEPDDFTVFLTTDGEPFSRDHLTYVVKERIDAAKTGKGGACHFFATAWPRTCTRTGPTSVSSSRSSDTRTSRPRRFTRRLRCVLFNRSMLRLIRRRSSSQENAPPLPAAQGLPARQSRRRSTGGGA